MTASVTIRIFAWPKPAMAWPSRALEPGPTSSVGCGMGMKRVSLPAPFISTSRPAARVVSGMKSKITPCLLRVAAQLRLSARILHEADTPILCATAVPERNRCVGERIEEFVRVPRQGAWRGGPFAPMLAALFGPDIAFMGELMTWLLAAAVLGLLAGGMFWRHRADARRAEAEREAQRRADEAAEARRLAAERAEAELAAAAEREARHQAALLAEQQRQAAEAQRRAAEQAEAQRQAELRAEQQRLAAEQAERVAAERAEQAAQAERQRQAAEQAERERIAAAEAEREAQRLAAEQAAPPPRPVPKSAAQTLVLVADDSKVVRIKTGRLLAQHQYQVSYASDGLDAVQQMQARLPDVLITDVEMPGMDGFELTRHIRGNPQTAQLPVIMITAADDRHRDEASAAGVSVLLGKPYSDEALDRPHPPGDGPGPDRGGAGLRR